MNIVKGVAGFIRRTSSGHHGGSAYRVDRFNLPRHKVYFSGVGVESVLHSLWQRYESTLDKAEKRLVFYTFIKQFVEVFRRWEPDTEEDALSTSNTSSPLEHPSQREDKIGCYFGHPTELLLALIEDVTHITSLVTEMDTSPALLTPNWESSLTITSEGLPLLEALMIVVRSTYNCEVLGYYGMVQKLIALIKAAVVQLKTVAGVLSVDDGISKIVLEKYRLLQKLLVHVLSTICSFIEVKSDAYEVAQLFDHTTLSASKDGSSVFDSLGSFNVSGCETSSSWKEKAVTTVMEAGGLNWLVELLRVIRRLHIEEQRQNMSLQYLILRALHSAIFENSRAQNHFRSIGGLEVLLDGIVPLSNCDFPKQSTTFSLGNGKETLLLGILQLHFLSLEVLREAIFGNLNNLQFLYEIGRVHKFANSFCSAAFILLECKHHVQHLVRQDEAQMEKVTTKNHDHNQRWSVEASKNHVKDCCIMEFWNNYVVALSSGLCSFILAHEDRHSNGVEGLVERNIPPVSAAYIELSIKWILKVLLVVFPCIKACSSENGLPIHLRLFVFTLQRNILHAFKKALMSSPSLLDVFRDEGIWELVFSENFFYFGPALEGFSGVSCTQCENSVATFYLPSPSASKCSKNVPDAGEVSSSQMEVISFVEFAATFPGTTHNTPECSALLDALEQSSSKPEVSIILAKSIFGLLKHSPERTVASFNKLDGVSRVLNVACIQAQKCSSENANDVAESYRADLVHSGTSQHSNTSVAFHRWRKCVEASVELFTAYLSSADDAKSLVLKSTSCIDCLFDLFWVEDLRNLMLGYILDLMKTTPISEEDKKGKLHLCSKYLETFNQVKEKEKEYTNISIDLLAGMREMLVINQMHYQALFHDGECFLHVVSLLNGVLPTMSGEKLVLSVLQTLTSLLSNNCVLKAAFRSLVGKGYQTLQNLLLDYCRGQPTEQLINALLDMLVDGKFDIRGNPLIQNEDAIILYLSVLQKSSDSLRQQGLSVFIQLLRDSISNRDSCVRAGMLDFLLDWFSQEESDSVILKISLLIQVTGGHSISGKDIRKIFALLRSEKVGNRQQYCSLLMDSILSMLNEKGPTAFFDFIGNDSGIKIKTPMQWPISKGFTFSCWLRIENFPRVGAMGLFSFLSEHGKGCFALLSKDKLIYESVHQKRQGVSLNVNIVMKKWHFLCITHSIGRAFSGGSILRCYVNGVLVSSERCRYPRINELLTNCSIGCKIHLPYGEEENPSHSVIEASSFLGQIGPIYMFNDAITAEQVLGINSLGPSYMYSFLDNEDVLEPLPGGVFDAKDGLASKMIFGLNAQASNGRTLYNVAPLLESAPDKSSIEATVMTGTQLCSRRLLQQIIYVVGGVSVFFPLFTQSQWFEHEEHRDEHSSLKPISKERLTAEVIELIASVIDENFANQQQMHLVSGFSILGFLLQSVPSQQLNLETLSALKHLFNVVANSGLSEFLVKDAVSCIFLNPLVWVHTGFKIQRELCMFLSQQFDNDPRLLSLCRLPHIIDLIHQYYWDNAKCRSLSGGKRNLHSVSEIVVGERPSREEIRKIRLLLLSLGEMSLRQSISSADVKALVAFFETSQDMACIEDLLHMILRAISQKALLVSFVEQVNSIGGCQVFINLLQREYEPIRLLSLQLIGKILIGLPSEKKGLRFFTLAVGRSKSISENTRSSIGIQQLLFSAISDRLFRFTVTEDLCAALFDALLGGASPKQVLQKQSQYEKHKSKRSGSQFVLPQMLPLIFKFLSECENVEHRTKIIADLLDLLDSNPSNIESLMEHGWNAWLTASMELTVVKSYKMESLVCSQNEISEQRSVRNLYSTVLGHYILTVKGGWQYLEETTNFILMDFEQGCVSNHYFLRDLYEDLIWRIWKISCEENILALQPCRDNTLYLLKLIDELLLSEIDHQLPFPAKSSELPPEFLDTQSYGDIGFALSEALLEGNEEQLFSVPTLNQPVTSEDVIMDEDWWTLYDLLWIIISDMNGKGQNKMLLKSASTPGPSLGQRARGLVESLNIPAAEMAAVVVSGGITNALVGKSSKNIDKAMLLRGEKCPRIVFRLLVLYLCRSSLPRASRCVQQIIPLLPCLLVGDDENSKNRLQLFIWFLLTVRSEYGMLDGGTRFHVMSHLIRETVSCGKAMLATSLAARDDSSETGTSAKDAGALQNLIQKDRILAAVSEESNYIKTLQADRSKQLQEWAAKVEESLSTESSQKRIFEDEVQSSLSLILASDDNRRSAFQLAYDEERQTVAEKWIHVFRSLIDERGPWSANPFPNCDVRRWKLDKTEDLWRRRPKLRQNYRFDENLCQPPASASGKEVIVSSGEIKMGSGMLIPEQMKQFLLKGIRRITDEMSSELTESDNDSSSQKVLNSEEICDQQSELAKDIPFSKDPVQERKDSTSTEVEGGEVLMSVPCVLITPKRKLFGQLAVMRNALHFFGEFLVEGTAGSSVFKNFDCTSNSEPGKQEHLAGIQKQKFLKLPVHITSNSEKQNSLDCVDKQPKNVKRHRRWNLSKVKAVHWTRYLLRYTAIEIFFSNSVAPVFFNFSSQQLAKNVGTLVVNTRNELLFPKGGNRDRTGSISLVDRRIAQELAESARESWRRREMTNFEYLMILNTLAGRSYNDLTQYPVFPWVLADYSSETLDFNKSSTFRDLSKPVGALDSKRFEVFEDRYRSFDDPDIPSFYYGSHYSSGGIVLYYLIRLEPLATLHRNLQGGKFDHADRLFQSIEGTYKNCLSNTSDVKELIPEFFYMPEFLVNSNSYHFGVRQDGEPIVDVCLPPWAKGSPEEFISKNREALESEYVSSNLHNWIDLVFGYKQRGKPAVEAANIFYYLTYEGAVELESMEDELQRSAIEDQIANFGQTPIQIFRKQHPRRGPPIPIAHPLKFAPGSINLTSVVSSKHPPLPLLYVNVFDSNVVLVSKGLNMLVKTWLTTQLQSGGNFTFSGSQDPLFGIGSDILSYRKIGSPLAEGFEIGAQCFSTLQTPSENFLISCGNWENSFQVISLLDGRVVQSIRAHKDVVSAVAVTSDGSILATGSYDTTVMVWEVPHSKAHEKRARNVQSELPRKDYVISETPFHILCGHDDVITCLYVSVELDVVISGSKDGTCVFHTLREGKYIRSIRHPCGSPLSKLVVSRHGWLVLYSDDDLSLHLYSINGKHIATTESNGRLNCVELSVCGEFLACAGDQGQIIVRSMRCLELVNKYAVSGKVITSLAVTPEECFLAGTKEGTLLVYSIENPQVRKATLSRTSKSRP